MRRIPVFALVLLAACSAPLSQLRHEILRPLPLDAGVQTYIEPPDLPQCAPVLSRLEHLADVSYVDASKVLWLGLSYTDAEGHRFVQIDQRLNACGRLETLAHELAHFEIPYGIYTQRETEMFVDAVSYLIARRAGIPTTTQRYGHYLSSAKMSEGVLVIYRTEIRDVAEKIWTGGR